MNDTSSEQKSYFDIHTSGIGYLQRVREVPVKGGRKAQPFLACTIAALVGPARDPILRYFDVRVSGAEAKKLVQPYLGIEDRQQRPLIRFRLGDLWLDPFRRPSSGEPAASMKARLLKAELLDRSVLRDIEQHELHTNGIGYLNNPRMLSNDGAPLMSCSLAVLAGPTDSPEYRYIETVVADDSAQELLQRCVQAVEAKQKVLLAFKLNDMRAEAYNRTKGEHAGEVGASLKSKLIHVSLIKIDGQQVYPSQSDAPETETIDSVPTDSEGSQTAAPSQAPEAPALAASF
ncbi:DUF3577 domain-containing protein [Pseudomonas sp. R3.Fl]|uniref:DUF3577 domain-containing protein n=1 Tax=Pseudomonas TaxID=286 RepID=UPI00201E291A|nr:DUF3577 domain-containing protein [Pseudomonas sp. R3.Fl]MCL6692306.1 DUF3577 domain-containing protein [Pseudomonas sp. R3.Fl]